MMDVEKPTLVDHMGYQPLDTGASTAQIYAPSSRIATNEVEQSPQVDKWA